MGIVAARQQLSPTLPGADRERFKLACCAVRNGTCAQAIPNSAGEQQVQHGQRFVFIKVKLGIKHACHGQRVHLCCFVFGSEHMGC